jgi:hypothetical protein
MHRIAFARCTAGYHRSIRVDGDQGVTPRQGAMRVNLPTDATVERRETL